MGRRWTQLPTMTPEGQIIPPSPPPAEPTPAPEAPPATEGEVYEWSKEDYVKAANSWLAGIEFKKNQGEPITKGNYDRIVEKMRQDPKIVQSTVFEGKNPRVKAGSWEAASLALLNDIIETYSG